MAEVLPIGTTQGELKAAIGGVSSLARGHRCVISGLFGSAKAFLLARAYRNSPRHYLAVLPSTEAAEAFHADLAFFLSSGGSGSAADDCPLLFYPSTELLPFEAADPHPDIVGARVEFLLRLAAPDSSNNKGAPFIAVTTAENLTGRIPDPATLSKRTLTLERGAEYVREDLLGGLMSMGYKRMTMVEAFGEFSVRGAIIDIFPPPAPANPKRPLRLEFSGDELESIRTFDPTTQRSERTLDTALLPPTTLVDLSTEARARAREALLTRADELSLERSDWEGAYNALIDLTETSGMERLLAFFEDGHNERDSGGEKVPPGGTPTILDHLPEDTVVALVDKAGVEAALADFHATLLEREKTLARGAFNFIRARDLYADYATTEAALQERALLYIGPSEKSGEITRESNMETTITVPTASNLALGRDILHTKTLTPLKERIQKLTDLGCRVVVTAHNRGQAERTSELLEELNPETIKGGSILLDPGAKAAGGVGPGRLFIAEGALSSGFTLPDSHDDLLSVITEEDIFGERVKRRPPPSKKAESFLNQMRDLKVDDTVVHRIHGIGLYRGLTRLNHDGIENDFLLLEYADKDKLYLPVQRMDLVTRYHTSGGTDGAAPRLDKLGKGGFEKTKKRVRRAAKSIAGELLKLYAEREEAKGYAFTGSSHLYTEFEASFEFTETPDQATAIDEVAADMASPRPMDRLVCGDVGYGKTEVAMRAAFKAALSSKQTAVIVPTTVLAQQHHLVFKKRFAPFPVTVEVLSRFKTKKEQKEVLDGLESGRIDIVIGTHRLLQKDVAFRDLGLLIIDEEHRFGVRAKERLKALKRNVDVLTLTATPIPRTLHTTLAGIRDLSVILTPPEDRLSVATRIVGFDEAVIREAIARELRRGGQIFFVHNRVNSIDAMHSQLKRITEGLRPEGLRPEGLHPEGLRPEGLRPEGVRPGGLHPEGLRPEGVRISVGHGQMPEARLEEVMLEFSAGKSDILLCTTIIESGLDIPSANTIIINRADCFGLAELYQLRGRVGRSHHRAYAYMISPGKPSLSGEAAKRLEVIKELSELGSGFRIASYDLEIRGGGELLGSAQSGHIAEVGFDLYTELLQDAIAELKGGGPNSSDGSSDGPSTTKDEAVEVNLPLSQFIDDDYVPDTRQRLGIYRRVATATTDEELILISEELTDRFGPLPGPADNLIEVASLRVSLKALGAVELTQRGERLYMRFSSAVIDGAPGAKGANDVARRALELTRKYPERFRATPDSRLVYTTGPGITEPEKCPEDDPLAPARYMLKALAPR